MILKEMPKSERPRERLLVEGSEYLSNTELIAIILRTGNKDEDVIAVSRRVLALIEDIGELKELSVQELSQIKGIGLSKAITLVAAIELGKRIAFNQKKKLDFTSPKAIYDYFYPRVKDYKQEHLFAIYLDIKGKFLCVKELTVGTISSTIFDPKLIFKWAYKFQASSIILVHNHPSGDSFPSIADIKMTNEIIKQSKIIGFSIIDHLIIGNTCFSMRRDLTTQNNIFIHRKD